MPSASRLNLHRITFGKILSALLILTLFFVVLILPAWVPALQAPDSGYEAASAYWIKRGLQHGSDLIFNSGPLGFITFPQLFSGFFDLQKIIGVGLLALALAFFAVRFIRLPKPFWVNALFLFSLWYYHDEDLIPAILALLAALELFRETTSRTIRTSACIILGALALTKGIYLFTAVFSVVLSAFYRLSKSQAKEALTDVASFALSFFVLWVACKQSPLNLWSFFSSAVRFSQGYSDTSGSYESGTLLALGLLATSICLLAIGYTAFRRGNRRSFIGMACVAAIECLMLFAAWKHGFVRASMDPHVSTFFYFCVISSFLFLWGLAEDTSPTVRRRKSFIQLMVLFVAGYGFYLNSVSINALSFINTSSYASMTEKLHALTHLKDFVASLRQQLRTERRRVSLPLTRKTVGDATIGYLGSQVAPMLYNRLDYRPTPSVTTFTAWTPSIVARDARFFANDATAPAYLVYDRSIIADHRLPAQEDSLAQLEIYRQYVPVLQEKGYVVLKRAQGTVPLDPKPIGGQPSYKTGDWLDVPQTNAPLWVKITPEPSLLSEVISLVYKPPYYAISIVTADGRTLNYRYLPTLGVTGFLLNPLLGTNGDIMAAYTPAVYQQYREGRAAPLTRVVRLRIDCPISRPDCLSGFSVDFSEIGGLRFGTMDQAPQLAAPAN
ncbi:MAG TPA: hypothetical protein VHL08_06365 [Dongiaceae bacterium]|jgi:hypothetical protein|nr:hypothetical protein [Dongiaceae bacterium]